jgi:hypothetical protein
MLHGRGKVESFDGIRDGDSRLSEGSFHANFHATLSWQSPILSPGPSRSDIQARSRIAKKADIVAAHIVLQARTGVLHSLSLWVCKAVRAQKPGHFCDWPASPSLAPAMEQGATATNHRVRLPLTTPDGTAITRRVWNRVPNRVCNATRRLRQTQFRASAKLSGEILYLCALQHLLCNTSPVMSATLRSASRANHQLGAIGTSRFRARPAAGQSLGSAPLALLWQVTGGCLNLIFESFLYLSQYRPIIRHWPTVDPCLPCGYVTPYHRPRCAGGDAERKA